MRPSPVCGVLGLEIPETFTTAPINSPTVMVHWRILMLLLACLGPKDLDSIYDQYPLGHMEGFGRREMAAPKATDSFFHLDRVREKLHLPNASYTDIMRAATATPQETVNVVTWVAVYCEPPTYTTREEVATPDEAGLGVAIGLHPKKAVSYSEADWTSFEDCLALPGVTALGEVGLDYSTNESWAVRHIVLDWALHHLSSNHVLVLHCRGPSSGQPDGWYMQLRFQLKRTVTVEQRIPLHCFNGSTDVVLRWLTAFPNIHFGFPSMVISFNAASLEALRRIPEDRILLETDAPYFRMAGKRWTTPALIGMVVALIAKKRGQPWDELLRQTLRNARQLYGLQEH